jgi:hypothetical protein
MKEILSFHPYPSWGNKNGLKRRLTCLTISGLFGTSTSQNVMHDQTHFKILTQTANGYIGVCSCCYQFNFVYRNILAVFMEEELLNFLDWLNANRYSRDYFVTLYHGRNKVYASPHSNLFLAFNDIELDEIFEMSAEVKLMIEAQKILLQKRIN